MANSEQNDGAPDELASSAGKSARKSRRSASGDADSTQGVKVRVRNAAVHILYRRLIGVALVALVAAAISISSLLAVLGKPVPPQYIPVTAEGLLVPLVPLSKPNTDHGGVGAFALEALRAINTYDYINWRDQLSAAEGYFSIAGWDSFQKQYQQSSTLNAVLARKMIVSVRPKGEIAFVEEGVQEKFNAYVWRVTIPMEVVYTAHVSNPNGATDAGSRQSGVATLYISRVATTQHASGLAIQYYIVSSSDAPPSGASAPATDGL